MDKKLLNKLKEQAKKLDVVAYDYSSEPPIPIHREIFDHEEFAKLVLAEAIYVGGGLLKDIEPQYKDMITVHEVGSWQSKMKKHFDIAD
jgi:hypothetical protein